MCGHYGWLDASSKIPRGIRDEYCVRRQMEVFRSAQMRQILLNNRRRTGRMIEHVVHKRIRISNKVETYTLACEIDAG